jgi:hypothetical protein
MVTHEIRVNNRKIVALVPSFSVPSISIVSMGPNRGIQAICQFGTLEARLIGNLLIDWANSTDAKRTGEDD